MEHLAAGTAGERQWVLQRPSRGQQPRSLLRAAAFPADIRGFAAMVIRRESGGNLTDRTSGLRAENPSGASGRWQFLNSWNHGGPYMVKDRLERFGMPHPVARKVRVFLSGLGDIRWWPGWYQDILFIEAMHRGGAHHWNG